VYAGFDSPRRRWDILSLKENRMKEECKHEPDLSTVRSAYYVDNGKTTILDVRCKRCGKSGSTIVSAYDFEFDEPCEVEDVV